MSDLEYSVDRNVPNDDDDSPRNKKKTSSGSYTGSGVSKRGRRRINIQFIADKSRRHITFSKRKAGIMKKAYELSTLTGTEIMLLIASETGQVFTFTTSKFKSFVEGHEGKSMINKCLVSETTQDYRQIHETAGSQAPPPFYYQPAMALNQSMNKTTYIPQFYQVPRQYQPMSMSQGYGGMYMPHPGHLMDPLPTVSSLEMNHRVRDDSEG